jgi:hypothetical protein
VLNQKGRNKAEEEEEEVELNMVPSHLFKLTSNIALLLL